MHNHKQKPVLIINCSNKKVDYPTSAFDLYQGDIFKVIRANTKDYNVLDIWDIYILSAEHGLISAYDRIEPYNTRMPKRSTIKGRREISIIAAKNKEVAAARLRQHHGVDLVVILTYDYLVNFDVMFEEHSLRNEFKSVTISRDHRGNGDMKKLLIQQLKLHEPI